MKALKYLVFMFLAYACDKPKTDSIQIPPIYHLATDSQIKVANDTVYFNNQKYSGYVYLLESLSKDTLLKMGYFNGMQNGVSKKWFPNKQLMEERHFLNGVKVGHHVAYWPNGNKRFEFYAVNGDYEGEMKEWSEKGKLFHLAHYKHGQEFGEQKMWYDNGKIRANYVIKNGRRFGLLGTKNCRNVSDSIFVVK